MKLVRHQVTEGACGRCDGNGITVPFNNEVQTCFYCKGRGARPGFPGIKEIECANCAGTALVGDLETEPDPCEVCEEQGYLPDTPATRRLNAQVRYLIQLWREAEGKAA